MDGPSPPCPTEQQLLDYVEGRLDGAGEAAIDGHLDACWSCTAVLAGLAIVPTTIGRPRGAPAQLGPGTRIDRYVLRAPLGAGAMGIVYDAFDPELDRAVAIKLVPAHGASGRARTLVLREAQALARLSHPGVVPVLAAGLHGDDVWVVMERIEGATARAWLRVEQRGWRDVLRIYLAAARALAAAHSAGIVHRDFKPDNVMVGADGRVRVIDFGLARLATRSELDSSIETGAPTELERTAEGAVIGTPAYMPPEQLLDAAVDARADQFALAVSLWEGLFGERPFAAGSLASLVEEVALGRVRVPPRRTGVPSALRRVLTRALSPRPEQRFADMDALATAIERASGARRRWIAAALVAAAGLAIVSLRPSADPCTPPTAPRWDAAARARLVEQLAVGEGAIEPVLRTIDARVDDWHDTWSRLCSATNGLDNRAALACLEVRRLELDAAIDVLLEGDDGVRARATEVTSRLPAAAPCVSSEPRLATLDPGALMEETARLRAQLARARALGDGGSYDEAIAIGRDVLARANELGDASLRVEAGWRVGALLVLAGDHNDAVQLLDSAHFEAREIGHDEVAAGTALELVEVLGFRLGRIDEAGIWLDHAAAALERWHTPDGDYELLRRRGRVAQRARECTAALGYQTGALAAIAAIADADDFRIARTIDDIGSVYWCLGRPELALAFYRDALVRREQIYGLDNAPVAYSLNNIGMVLAQLDEPEAAIDHHLWALAILERTLGANHPFLASAHNNLGAVWGRIGEYPAAATEFAAALAIFEVLGPAQAEVALALRNFGAASASAGDPMTGADALERALAIDERIGNAEHVRSDMLALGQMLQGIGADARAAGMLERALADGKPVEGYTPRDVAVVWWTLGAARLGMGRSKGAAEALAAARIAAAVVQPPDPALTHDLEVLANALARAQASSSRSTR